MRVLLAATLLAASSAAQQQTSGTRAGWPCGARMDPSYFDIAEASGGHLLLVAGHELADSAPLLVAFGEHKETMFRLAGNITPGLHEFRVPIDASVQSVLFSISIQCLQTTEVLGPSGTPVQGTNVTDLADFRAERMVIVKRPEPGLWTIRAAGSGIGGIMVQGRSELGIAQVRFAANDSPSFAPAPLPGMNRVRIEVRGKATDLEASLVDAASRKIATLPLTAGDTEGTYLSGFGVEAGARFRIQVDGKDASGAPFRRVHAPLYTVR